MVFIVRDSSKLSRPESSQKIIKAGDFWAYKQAQDAIAEGMQRRQEIIDATQAAYEAEQRRGYQDGVEQGKLEQASHMVDAVARTVEYFVQVENQMVDLVLDAIRRIASDFNGRERVIAVVRSALSLVRSQKHLVLRVHASQVEVVRAQMEELLAAFPSIEFVDIVGDNRLTDDGCMVESDIGVVETSLAGQIDVIQECFKKIYSGEPPVVSSEDDVT
jgi:type III secretion protein L